MHYVDEQGEGVVPENTGTSVAPTPKASTPPTPKPAKVKAKDSVKEKEAGERPVTPKEVDSDFRGQILPQ